MTNSEKLENVKACVYKIASDTSLAADVEHDLTEEKLTWMLFVLQQLASSSMSKIVSWTKTIKTIASTAAPTVVYSLKNEQNVIVLSSLKLTTGDVDAYYYDAIKASQNPYIPLSTIETMYSTYGQYSTWKLAQEIRTTYATEIAALPTA